MCKFENVKMKLSNVKMNRWILSLFNVQVSN